jgi:hypothetical protein
LGKAACKDYDTGKSHSANKTIWDRLTLKTKPFGTAHPEKQNLFRYTLLTQITGPLGKGSALAELLQQARLPKRTIWERHALQTEPLDHAHRQVKPFGTSSPCKQNHFIMLTGKQHHLEQAHPAGRTI